MLRMCKALGYNSKNVYVCLYDRKKKEKDKERGGEIWLYDFKHIALFLWTLRFFKHKGKRLKRDDLFRI
jgi:hypothetical protein